MCVMHWGDTLSRSVVRVACLASPDRRSVGLLMFQTMSLTL